MQPETICLIFGAILLMLLYFVNKNIYKSPKYFLIAIIIAFLAMGFLFGAMNKSCHVDSSPNSFSNKCKSYKAIGQPFIKFASLFKFD